MKTLIDNEEFRLVMFDSGSPGLTVCISGGVHGDEICGVKAIEKIEYELKHNNLLSGRLLTLIANKKAIESNKRFIDFDLNRSFDNPSAIGYESILAEKITAYLTDIDLLLDLHSTSAPTKPFGAGILSENHIEIFNKINIEFYTCGWEIHRGYSMLVDEVNRCGGIGLIVECGKQGDSRTVEVAHQAASTLLRQLKLLPEVNSNLHNRSTIIQIKKIIKSKTDNFRFNHSYKNLDFISANEIVAYDNDEPISYPYSFLISMPSHKKLLLGEEAFGIGIIKTI